MQVDLLKALRSKNLPVVSSLLLNHPFLRDIQELDSRLTPVFIVADTFEDEQVAYIFNLLFQANYNFLKKDRNQRTIFFFLARRGLVKSFKFLIRKYAGLWSEVDCFGQTPLFAAAKHNQINIFRAAPLSEILLNSPDEITGQTVLFHAVAMKHHDLCIFLLKNGSNPSVIDHCGNSVLDYTSLFKKEDIQLKKIIHKFQSRAKNTNDFDRPQEKNICEAVAKSEVKPKPLPQLYMIKLLSEGKTEVATRASMNELFVRFKQLQPLAQGYLNSQQSIAYQERKRWRVVGGEILRRCMKGRYSKWFEHTSSAPQLLLKDLKKDIKLVGLREVEEKLEHSVYLTPTEFMTELSDVWQRCEKMNPNNSGIVIFARMLKDEFYHQCNKVDYFGKFCVVA